MIGSIKAELLLLSKRAATWTLLGIWMALATFFGYILPYVSYRNDEPGAIGQIPTSLDDMLPHNFLGAMLGGFPFFGGVLILILGVMTLGSEYGWGTLKTVFTQRPGRLEVFGAKMIALGIWLLAFVAGSFMVGAAASYIIAIVENAAIDWPGMVPLLKGFAGAWLIMAVWAALGVLLGVLSRGTALAIGIGILYGLVIEGLISALFDQVDLLQPVIKVLIRANAYSLAAALGTSAEDASSNGPGAFSGPWVSGTQATVVLLLELAVFLIVTAALLRRRDVS
jgi:ABC-type transport system involved in multi-copper enzyme maturation permease subunit